MIYYDYSHCKILKIIFTKVSSSFLAWPTEFVNSVAKREKIGLHCHRLIYAHFLLLFAMPAPHSSSVFLSKEYWVLTAKFFYISN